MSIPTPNTRPPNALLRQARRERKWTYRDVTSGMGRVARLLGEAPTGVDPNAVSRWERGLVTPGRANLRLLCLTLDRTPEDLGFAPGASFLEELALWRRRLLTLETGHGKTKEKPAAARGGHVWHHRVHERWAGERLHFLWFSVLPTYDPHTAPLQLQAILEYDIGVTSFELCELFGSVDLVARMWLPAGVGMDQIESRCLEVFGPLTQFRPQAVDRILRDWAWGPGDLPEPDPAILTRTPVGTDVDVIRGIDDGTASPEEVAKFHNARLITPIERSSGLRFFIEVTVAEALNMSERASLQLSLLNTLSESRHIFDKSLYRMAGPSDDYVISGRVAYDDIFAISHELTEKIPSIAHFGALGGHAYTHICSQSRMLGYRERMNFSFGKDQPEEGLLAALGDHS
jgi:transcriptional regulator with XRE-family HTH domain